MRKRNPRGWILSAIIAFELCTGATLLGQGGLAVLQYPTAVRAAGMGLVLDAANTPSSIFNNPDHQAGWTAWHWLGGVNGIALSVNHRPWAVTLNYFSIEGFQYRTEIPTSLPLFEFGYSNAAAGLTLGKTFGKIRGAINGQFLWERTLSYSATGLDLSVSGEFPISEAISIAAGLRHAGFMSNLNQTGSTLPTAIFGQLAWSESGLNTTLELANDDFPFKLGASYALQNLIRLYAGLQVGNDYANSNLRTYGSAGLEIDWQTFSLGIAMYQINHPLAPRQYVTLSWRF